MMAGTHEKPGADARRSLTTNDAEAWPWEAAARGLEPARGPT